MLEAIVLKGALGMTEDDISHLNGLAYSKNFDDACDAVESGRADAGFFMRAHPGRAGARGGRGGRVDAARSRPTSIPRSRPGLVFNLLE